MAWLRERRLRALSTSDAGSLMAVEADRGETKLATGAARKCQVWGLVLWWHSSYFSLACPQGQLSKRSWRKRPTDELCVAKPVGWQQGLTTGEGWCGRLLEISSKSLCISFLVLLCHGGQWKVCHKGRSWAGEDGLPSWRRALPNIGEPFVAWPQCWIPPHVRGLQCWWRSHSNGSWGWCRGSAGESALGVEGGADRWPTTLSRTGGWWVLQLCRRWSWWLSSGVCCLRHNCRVCQKCC